MRLIVSLAALSVFFASTGCSHTSAATHPHWTYEGTEGPVAWGGLSPEFAACSTGKNQSPIDLTAAAPKDLPALAIDWKPSKLALTNNGHTVQQAAEPGSSLEVGGVRFQLAQWHFHHQSEHALDGKRFPLEVHLVHKGPNGELAVVGIFFEAGAENPALATIVGVLPASAGATATSDAQLDPNSFLPKDRTFFAYSGSLTTPPCTEGVKWHVFKTPVTASAAQLEAFARLFENNARPLAPVGSRELVIDSTP